MQQPGLRRLQLARVAAASLDVEEQIVPLQQLGDIRLQRDEVGRILRVAADGNRARHVPMDEPERAAEQVDAGRDHRRTDAVVVEHERFDQVIEMRLVIRDVDHPPGLSSPAARWSTCLVDAFDLAEDRIERVLQRAVDGVALRRPQLVEIRMDPLPRLEFGLPMAATQISRHVLAREDCLGDVVEHHGVELYHQ